MRTFFSRSIGRMAASVFLLCAPAPIIFSGCTNLTEVPPDALTPTNASTPAAAAGFIAADVNVAFGSDGTMAGHLYAIHCASFDTPN